MSTVVNTHTSQSITQPTELVEIFTGSSGSKQIVCEADWVLDHLIVVCDAQVEIEIIHHEWSLSRVRAIVLSSWVETSLKLTARLSASQCESNVHIVSMCTPHSDITVDGNIILDPGIVWSTWNLLEQNVLLWGKIRLRTLPVLDVRSNDIIASHGAKVDRIDPMQMFYCMSRGLDRGQSTQLIIESMIRSMTDHIQSESIIIPLTSMLSNYVLSCMWISWPQIQAPSNRSHRVSHHLLSTQHKL